MCNFSEPVKKEKSTRNVQLTEYKVHLATFPNIQQVLAMKFDFVFSNTEAHLHTILLHLKGFAEEAEINFFIRRL